MSNASNLITKKYIRSNNDSNFIIKLGIILSIAITITTLSIINGFSNQIENVLFKEIPHIQINNIEKTKDKEKIKSSLNKIGNIKHYQFKYSTTGMLRKKDIKNLLYLKEAKGCENRKLNKNELCLGKKIIDKFRIKKGEKISFTYQINGKVKTKQMMLKGVYKSGTFFEEKIAVVSEGTIKELLNIEKENTIEIILKEKDKSYETYLEISSKRISKDIQNLLGEFDYLYKDLVMLRIFSYTILIFITLLCFLNIMSNLIISIKNKKEEIKTLRTIGISKKEIKKVFLSVTIYNYLTSIIIGNIIGIIFSLNLDKMLLIYEKITGEKIIYGSGILSNLSLNINFIDVFLVSILVFLIGLISTYITVSRSIKK